jgi:hypothetical protein
MAPDTAANLNSFIARWDGNAESRGRRPVLAGIFANALHSASNRVSVVHPTCVCMPSDSLYPHPTRSGESRPIVRVKKEITPCPMATMTGSP